MWVIGLIIFCIDTASQKYEKDGKFYESAESSENDIDENVEKRSVNGINGSFLLKK